MHRISGAGTQPFLPGCLLLVLFVCFVFALIAVLNLRSISFLPSLAPSFLLSLFFFFCVSPVGLLGHRARCWAATLCHQGLWEAFVPAEAHGRPTHIETRATLPANATLALRCVLACGFARV